MQHGFSEAEWRCKCLATYAPNQDPLRLFHGCKNNSKVKFHCFQMETLE